MTWRFIRRSKDLIITDLKLWWREVSSRICELRILRPETEILKETPWSIITEQNSVNKELLEIVGNGKPTGSVLKETIVVSVTMSISVQNRHSRILLRVLPCSRMREMRREPDPKLWEPTWHVDMLNLVQHVHFASLMDICHLKNAELEAKHQKYTGRVVLRGEIVKDDSGSYAVFTEQGSSASQMTAAKVMDIISRLPGCAGQAADAVSAYTQ